MSAERKDYHEIASVEELVRWLGNGEYGIAEFGFGMGLSRRDVGGCWGVFAPGVVQKAIVFGIVGRDGRLTERGHRLRGDIAHVPQREGDCPLTKTPCRYGCEMECFLEP